MVAPLNNKGFTLIEILVGLSVILILSFLGIVSLTVLQNQVDIDLTTQGIMSTLRLARSRTLGSEGGTSYGVHFETTKYVLFSGNTYVSGAAGNKEYLLNGSEIFQINLSGGGSEVIFDRVRGTTSQTGEIGIRLVDNTSRTSVIKINSSGQLSLNDTLAETGSRINDSRHLHLDLGWSIQTASTLTLAFSDTTPVTQNVTMNSYFNSDKSEFDWSGSINVNGSTQVLRVHTHLLSGSNTILSVHRDRRYNDKALTVSIDSKEIVSYTATGTATVGGFGGTMTVQ